MTSSTMCSSTRVEAVSGRTGRSAGRSRAFTLTELLAVLAIVLVVVAGSIGVWLALAESVGPGQATAVVQAMLNGARDCSVSGLSYKDSSGNYVTKPGVYARVVFRNDFGYVDKESKKFIFVNDVHQDAGGTLDLEEREQGTQMVLQYWNATGAPKSSDDDSPNWVDVPARGREYAGRNMLVLRDIPTLATAPTSVGVDQVQAWEDYRANVSKALAEYAFVGTSGGYLGANPNFQSTQKNIFMTFDPRGVLTLGGDESQNPLALVIIQLAGQRVGEYEFYVLNANTGTQLVFE